MFLTCCNVVHTVRRWKMKMDSVKKWHSWQDWKKKMRILKYPIFRPIRTISCALDNYWDVIQREVVYFILKSMLLLRFHYCGRGNWISFLLQLSLSNVIALFVLINLEVIAILAIPSYQERLCDWLSEGTRWYCYIFESVCMAWSENLFWIEINKLGESNKIMVFLDWLLWSNDSR